MYSMLTINQCLFWFTFRSVSRCGDLFCETAGRMQCGDTSVMQKYLFKNIADLAAYYPRFSSASTIQTYYKMPTSTIGSDASS